MKFSIEVKEMRKAIEPCARIVPAKAFVPILTNALIEAGNGEISFTCSDLDQVIRMKCAADVRSPGRTTASAAKLYDIARNMPEGASVSMEVKEGNLEVKSGRSRFLLRTLPADDFPSAKSEDRVAILSLTPSELTKLMACGYAAEATGTRAYLSGVCLVSAGDEIHAVASDGHRLALHKLAKKQDFPTVIIPAKAVKEFVRLAAAFDDAATIEFGIGPNGVGFYCGSVSMTTKVIDGTFPDYMRLIPRDFIATASIDKDALLSAISRVSLIVETSSPIKIEFKDGKCCASSSSSDSGEGYDEFEAECDQTISAMFSADFLAQAISSFSDRDTLRMSFTDSMAYIVSPSSDDQSAIVMSRRF